MNLFEDLAAGRSIKSRLYRDSFFKTGTAAKEFNCPLNENILFVQENYMKNRALWRLFVRQFQIFSDSVNNGWRGEYWGKSMRGAVTLYEYSGDRELYEILTESIRDMLGAEDAHGRFSTYEVYNEFGNWDIWCRKYVMLGFLYYYDICGDESLKYEIKTALCRHADYIMSKVGRGKREITDCGLAKLRGINASSILEAFVRLYNITDDKRYLDFAEYITECGGTAGENIFRLAFTKEKMPYEFSVTKAYEMMSCFEGLLELYRVTGTEWYREAVINFVQMIAETDITVIGGSGCHHEFFDNSEKTQTDPTVILLKNETCVTVTWMKLCAGLLLLTGEEKYAEYIEKSGYNALLGAVNTKACRFDFSLKPQLSATFIEGPEACALNAAGLPFDSYSPLLPGQRGRGIGGFKRMVGDAYYGCCASIGAAGLGVLANIGACYARDGIVLNFYNNGKYRLLTPQKNEFAFAVSSCYPLGKEVRIRIEKAPEEEFSLYFRVPSWSGGTDVYVNGEKQLSAESGYAKIKALWKEGDEISFTLRMPVEVLSQDGYAAVKYGAVVLARDEAFGDSLDIPVLLDKESLKLCDNKRFGSQICFTFKNGGEDIFLCDYASAGKDWYNGKRIAAWFSVKQ